MTNLTPADYKADVIVKDWEIAHATYQGHFNYISTLRGWTVTLLLAYIGFLVSIKSDNFLIILPFVIVLLVFMYLEGGARARAALLVDEIRGIERIFMESDAVKFTELVRAYEFRDIRPYRLSAGGLRERIHILRYMLRSTIVGWHLALLLLVTAAYLAIVFRLI